MDNPRQSNDILVMQVKKCMIQDLPLYFLTLYFCYISGMDGNDTLSGGLGSDWLEGSEDFDSLKSCQSANVEWKLAA